MKQDPSSGVLRLNSLICEYPPPPPDEPLPLAVLPGEGIGPELIATCLSLLETIEKHTDYRFDVESGGKIGKEALEQYGNSLPEQVVSFCNRSFERGAPLLCGPGGDRFVYQLRHRFDIFCKFAPLRPLPSLRDTGPMREEAVLGSDILLIRENMGGVYQGEWRLDHTATGRYAHHSFYYDENQVRRIIALAVEAARRRRGKLCVVHKPGGTPSISELWTDVARDCADGSGIELRLLEVDTAGYLMLADANSFDVVVTPNMFGDVLADTSAALLGSRGMSYSWNVNERGWSVYQTGHGAAYDLAGSDMANPLGQIQTLAALLRESFGLPDLAATLVSACDTVLENGYRTADILRPGGGVALSTREMGAAVARQLAFELSGMKAAANVSRTG